MTDREGNDFTKERAQPPESIALLVVDDDEAVLQVTRLVLSRYRYRGAPLEILEAQSAEEARRILSTRHDIAVILLDVVMEHDHAGLELVEYIRNSIHNHRIRIIIRTGQPGYAPEKQVVQDYEINDYLMKSDATQSRMVVSLTTAIRSYLDIVHAEDMARCAERSDSARKNADFASHQKTQFLAHMSHEIRTPLNGIVGLVDLLAETSLHSDQAELVEDLKLSADVLLGLVNDVLDISKIESGKLELTEALFSPVALLDKVSVLFTAVMQRKNIEFIQEYSSLKDRSFLADAHKLQQVLINFIGNACKFTPHAGRICLRASFTENNADSADFIVEVEDNGPGIRPDRIRHIFDAYEQEAADTSQRYGGTGLGLSLSQSLAQLMNGEVGVDSTPGEGSRFWVRVPVKYGVVEDSAGCETASDMTVLAGWNILVAEDDPTSQKVIVRLLSKMGAIVQCFGNGQALLEQGDYINCDAILLDCHMPVMGGQECARELRRNGYSGPLLALTAAVSDEERQACLDSGMDDVLAKPLNRQRLAQWLTSKQH